MSSASDLYCPNCGNLQNKRGRYYTVFRTVTKLYIEGVLMSPDNSAFEYRGELSGLS